MAIQEKLVQRAATNLGAGIRHPVKEKIRKKDYEAENSDLVGEYMDMSHCIAKRDAELLTESDLQT